MKVAIVEPSEADFLVVVVEKHRAMIWIEIVKEKKEADFTVAFVPISEGFRAHLTVTIIDKYK